MHNQDAASPEAGGERLVAGRYRLLSVLGEGGMGTVWRARDEVLHREVAVKEVRASAELPAERSARMYTRLEREAWAAARINARGVVTVYDVATFDGRPWIVMELVRGRSLADVIGAGGALAPKEAARIGVEVLAALCAAHGAGVLHRDVKPANVLLADEGRVVLTDFGIATVEGDTALTMTGEVVGSPEYLAPERALGRTPGTASDLWSLGVLLYAAVQGRSPFRRTTALATLRAVVDDELPPPHRAGPLTSVIEGLMRKDPEERMTAEQAERELRLAAGESAVPSEADTATDTTTDATVAVTAAVTAVEELPTAASAPGETVPTATDGDTTAAVATAGTTAATPKAATPTAGSPATGGTATVPVPEAAAAAPAATVPAPVPSFGPPPEGFGPVIAAPGPGFGHDIGSAPAPARRNRRTAYLIGAGAAVLVLLGAGLTYALVGKDGGGDEDGGTGNGKSASQPVSVTVAGGATTYDGSCPPGDAQAPWFTATFTTTRPPVQFSYRWVSENGSVIDQQWRTLTFREGDPTTKKETVRLSTWAREGTLRSALAVEIKSPFDAKSNSVPFSVTCRPNDE
ncbi:serine/threonine protein kinase [Streptomyces bingchenggensis BCW-1]|uniref:non-specific serine/threonine protein kinase n=1 Tax=Streptomyces bingchenggensis (strain BCW-1) TaxID=749414 RepID=D7CAY5_STRBB|nr:serine/threonine-protein kinase [Streptomyces bingchenggensis]ADI10668.1 serine/threonine protein kinase [Streptomyces bingchenggensis BCW-1]